MRRPFALLAAVVVPIAIGAGWSGDERLPLPSAGATMTARAVPLDPGDPRRRRVGALTWLGGVELRSGDRAFGGFSTLHVAGDRFTLLSDGGILARFRMGGDWRPRDVRLEPLPGGPGTGWTKGSRDSESMTVDPRTGAVWVGFEVANAIWRYAPGLAHAERGVAPPAMAGWRYTGGIESFTRLADGRFVAIAESREAGGAAGTRMGIVWAGDPVRDPAPAFRFRYRPTRGYDPSDMTELPDGRLLVLERRFALPFTWSNRLMLVERGAVRPGAVVAGRLLATLAAPLVHDNFEGVAATRERGATIVWLVSDDNQLFLQRSLLLKFRLDR
jgi:hypothetical protein